MSSMAINGSNRRVAMSRRFFKVWALLCMALLFGGASTAQAGTPFGDVWALADAGPAPLSLNCSSGAGPATVGASYSITCTASGGTPPYNLGSSGSQPAGLVFSFSGTNSVTLSGMPTTAGTYSYSITLSDSGSPAQTASQFYSGTVVAVGALTVSCNYSGSATVGQAYSGTCTAAGGTPGYTWSNADVLVEFEGSICVVAFNCGLPVGVTFSASGNTLTFAGVPTVSGPYDFAFQAADSGSPAQTQTVILAIGVQAPISGLTPSTISSGSSAFTLTVNGAGFGASSAVQWNGTSLLTTIASATQLTALVPANLIVSPGEVRVTVVELFEFGFSSATSQPAIFTIANSSVVPQSWTQLSPSGGPPAARGAAASVFDAATSQMIVFGGSGSPDLSDTWALTLSGSPAWSQLSPPGAPPGRTGASAVYDSANSKMTIFGGGFGQSSPCANDAWVLSNANQVNGSPAWAPLAPTGTAPAPRIFHSAVYDATSNRMMVFGGNNCFSAGAVFYNDVWVLTNANGLGGTPGWVQLTPTGALPPARENFTAVYDAASNRMIVFGGAGNGSVFNDVWVLSNANGLNGTPAWTQLTTGGAQIPPTDGHTAVYDSANNRMLVFSGGSTTLNSNTWDLSNANGLGGTPIWTELSISGTLPPARSEATAVYDAAFNRMIVFGGGNLADTPLGDVWVLAGASAAQPSIIRLVPNSAAKNSGTTALTVTGANILSGAAVQWTGPSGAQVTLPGSFISSAQIQASVPASFLTSPGVAQVAILNPGNVASASLPFLIANTNQAPVLNSITPTNDPVNAPAFTMTANGSNFQLGASIWWTGPTGATATLPANFIGAAQLQAIVPASLLTTPGTAQAAVYNPDFGLSASQPFTITSGVSTTPSIISATPNTAVRNSAPIPVSVNGSGIQVGASVQFTPPLGAPVTLPGSFVSSAQIQATIPANLLTSPGVAQVGISNPGNLSSGTVSFLITDNSQAPPVLTAVSPNNTPATASLVSVLGLTLTGSNFQSGASIWWTGPSGASVLLPASFVNSTQLLAAIPSVYLGAPGMAQVAVLSPGFGLSAPQPFVIAATGSAPQLTSLAPNPVVKNSGPIVLSANGSNIPAGSSLWWTAPTGSAISLPASFISSSQLQASVSSSLLTTPGTAQVAILSPGYTLSGSQTLVITNSSQSVQPLDVTPASGSGASQVFTFQFFDNSGTADLSTVSVLFNGSPATAAACMATYNRAQNTLALLTDSGAQPAAAITPGSGSQANSQCTLTGSASSVTASGNVLTLKLAIGFNAGFAGSKNTYGMTQTVGGTNSGWQQLGTWTVMGGGAPTPVSVTPSSGIGTSQIFTFVYTDPNGASDLASAQANINGSLSNAGGCYVWVTPGTGAIWLDSDGDNGWSAQMTTGNAGTLQNSQCAVNVGQSSGTLSGNTYTLNLAIAFQSAFTGAKNIYGDASSLAGLNSGWQNLGTWIAGNPGPVATPVSVTPNAGMGPSQSFTFLFNDAGGATDLSAVTALIGSGTAVSSACAVVYNRASNTLALLTDAGALPSNPITAGGGALQNSQCVLTGSASSVSLSGNVLTLTLAIGFNSGFAGAKTIYGSAANSVGNISALQQLGTWTVTAGGTARPLSVMPSSGSGTSQTFTFLYSDANGAGDMASAQANINGSLSNAGGCYVWVTPGTGAIWLDSDKDNGWSSQMTLGAAGTLQNSQCSVNVAQSSGTISAGAYTLNLAITFQSAFSGAKNSYGYASTLGGLTSGWTALGHWTVAPIAPVAVSVAPSSGTSGSASQTFTLVYTDANGAADLSSAQMMVSSSVSNAGACYVWVTPGTGAIWLDSDGDNGWSPQLTLGGPGVLQNSQCVVNVAASNATLLGNTYTLDLAITFQSGFTGTKNLYSYATSATGTNSGKQNLGSWAPGAGRGPAVPGSLTPAAGSGQSQVFTVSYSDTAGIADLSTALALFGSSPWTPNTCAVLYNRAGNTFALLTDAGALPTGTIAPGSGSQQNSQCTLTGSASSATISGNTLTLNLAIGFKPAFAGAKNVYATAVSGSGATSGTLPLGSWTVSSGTLLPPQPVSVTPSSGSGVSQTFTFVYSDSAGAADLASAQAIVNTSVGSSASCYVWVTPGTGAVWLAADDGSWSAQSTLGTTGTMQNSQCGLNVGASSGAISGNTYTLNLAMTFQSGFAGTKNTYGLASTLAGLSSGWLPLGTWNTGTSSGGAVSAVSVAPSSGMGPSQVFSFQFSDTAGAADLSTVTALIGASASKTSACAVVYNRVNNTLALLTDGGLQPSSVIAPGSGAQQNSQCTLTGSASSVTLSGDNLTLTLAIGFTSGFSGGKTIYGAAQSLGGASAALLQLGMWTVPVTSATMPRAVSVTPSSGASTTQSSNSFTFVYTDSNGASDLASAQANINGSLSNAGGCYVWVTPATGTLWLDTDADNGWSAPMSLGGSGSLQNSQCVVDLAQSSATLLGSAYTLTLSITFQNGFTGIKNIYGYASSLEGLNSGWQDLGISTISVPAAAVHAVSVAPASGSGSSQVFSFVFSDNATASDLSTVTALIGTSISASSACAVTYNRANNTLALLTDGGLQPSSVIAPGSGSQQNSQCTLTGSASSVTVSGNNLTLTLAIGFTPGFAGTKTVYGSALSLGGAATGTQPLGTWTATAASVALHAVSVTPSSGSGAIQTFALVFSDTGGASDLASAQVMVNSSFSAAGACYIWVTPSTGAIWLDNDANNAWSSQMTLGASGSLQNSQCTVNVGASSGALAGNSYTLNLAITFQTGFSGTKNVYGYAASLGGLNSGWQTLGTWTPH